MAETLKPRLVSQAMVATALFGSGLALETGLMIRRALWLRGVGPICGVHAASLHCPGCYAALSLMLAALLVAQFAPPVRARQEA